MKELRLHGKVRRVGNSLAILIPAKEAREAGMKEGDSIAGSIHSDVPEILGLLKGKMPYEPFSRRDFDHDRF
jgi:antitoxin component of MazEF toxin-antitoxin module